jgi:hypothetical protein
VLVLTKVDPCSPRGVCGIVSFICNASGCSFFDKAQVTKERIALGGVTSFQEGWAGKVAFMWFTKSMSDKWKNENNNK